MEIVVPKRYPTMNPFMFPIFLAGPVLGGGGWQEKLIKHFVDVSVKAAWTDTFARRALPCIRFVVPCRWDDSHPLSASFVKMYDLPTEEGLKATQTYWEAMFLMDILKKKHGLVVFGLFPEDSEHPRSDGQPYGRDTYGEVGRYTTVALYEGSEDHLLIGANDAFRGFDVQFKNLMIFHDRHRLVGMHEWVTSPKHLADRIAARLFKMMVS